MADFAPPSAPPPPKVPEGWKAVWNDQYKEYFYVNIYTKKSQWDKPDSPVYPPGEQPDGPPPYHNAGGAPVGPEKPSIPVGGAGLSEDEKLARKLQEEENARAGVGSAAGAATGRGAADSYYGDGPPPQQYQQQPYQQPPYQQGQQQGYPPQGYPPQQQYGQSPQPGYGGQSPQPGYGYQQPPEPAPSSGKKGFLGKLLGGGKKPQQQGYPQQGYGQQQQGYGRPNKPGMGALGGAGLGAAGGLAGGMLLGSALGGHHHHGGYGGDDGGYGGDDGGRFGGDDGGGFGGDDGGGYGGDDGGMFGGDDGGGFGGDDGGGDFGGDF